MSTGRSEGELRQDIERTRQQLGETAEALAAKADVKARARQKVNQVKAQATSRAAQARQQATARAAQAREQAGGGWLSNPPALAAAAAIVFAGIAIALWRRR
jgi:hypothetical protein